MMISKMSRFFAFPTLVAMSIISTSFAAPCVDDLSFMFKNDPAKNCAWVADNSDARCKKSWKGKELETYCPDSCNLCSVVATNGTCEDDPDFKYQNKKKKNCKWVGKSANKRCKIVWKGVPLSTNCLVSCNHCPGCKNDDSIRYDNNKKKNCNWVGRTSTKSRCKQEWEGKTMAEHCPLSCDSCPATTEPPTVSPTNVPSESPADLPTGFPTVSPSVTPSFTPSKSPTVSPTASPSFSPSYTPSKSPTKSPTFSPSVSPTDSPSLVPTTESPTVFQSVSPSKPPTVSPTAPVSKSPSESPSVESTTEIPTIFPTQVPTPFD